MSTTACASRPDRMVLVDVPEPYGSFLGDLARRYGVKPLVARHSASADVSGTLPALLVCGVARDDRSACERVRLIRKAYSGVPTVVLADGIGTDSVVRLVRMKVADVIGLPAPASDVAARALAHLSSGSMLEDGPDGAQALIGKTAIMQDLNAEIAAVARSLSTVLLTGETGTGKGVAARRIHELSSHSDEPFVMINCAALSPSLIESELFGHERGSFTGATCQRRGRFELAEGGAIFLDEVGELDLQLQAKLLRVLQDREYERIGGTQTRTLRARVIAATNRDLRREVQNGGFRPDLYFRLDVFHLRVPALRERLDDLPLLARSMIADLGTRLGIDPPHLSDEFLEVLSSWSWPGNVRELVNVLERLMVRGCGGTLCREDLAGALRMDHAEAGWATSDDGPMHVPERGVVDKDPDDEFSSEDSDDKECLSAVLRATGGNVARAARRLDIPRSTLRYRIRRHNLQHLVPRD